MNRNPRYLPSAAGSQYRLVASTIVLCALSAILVEAMAANYERLSMKVPYVQRDGWDAKPPKDVQKFSGPIPYVIIHHSYIPAACTSERDCIQAMQLMQQMHQLDRGWNDIGYSFAVGGDGRVYEGRGFNVIGAHAPRYNDRSIGICLIGDWRYELPSPKMLEATKDLIQYGLHNKLISANYTLIGHRQTRPTECPGDRLYQEIQSWPHYSPMEDVVDPNSIPT
ncbi:peptidoglycan-recognition protein LB-like isoform X1 [Uranotaenia lowii]|uniref:peptidoglycan-recognition protein LB-like isoform X1 n=1 Tax=Uranotaenia lowii TaxID=190385 RepID=UPI00247A14A1|nr:peptidoglycan-recognition protein LB-like isoform X1 [Uranotaenia lowii]